MSDLVLLVNSLSKGEKRKFRMTSQQTSAPKLYVKLFDHIIKHGGLERELALRQIPEIKRSQYANVKANLYTQILRCLREIHREGYSEIKARELFDFAKVLYARGQYKQSLRMIAKVKSLCDRIQNSPLRYLAISFEKQIESQHVTGSMSHKALELSVESSRLLSTLSTRNQLSNSSLLLYGMYLEQGFAKNQRDIAVLEAFRREHVPVLEENELDFYERLYYYQGNVWYYLMMHNFSLVYRNSVKWVALFDEFPDLKIPARSIYIKGLHNVLNALFMLTEIERFQEYLSMLEEMRDIDLKQLSLNERSQLDLFILTHRLNQVFLTMDYQKGIELARLAEEQMKNNELWDLNRRMTLHYKIACIYFGANRLDDCLTHLVVITQKRFKNFKNDIQCFALILQLIAHYDREDVYVIDSQIRSLYRFLLHTEELQQVQKEIVSFLRALSYISPDKLAEAFSKLKSKLELLEEDRLERRAFLYLDIISWLDSKLLGVSMEEAIRRRRSS